MEQNEHPDPWNQITLAVACGVQYERLVMPSRVVDESTVRRTVADVVTSVLGRQVDAEATNKRVDLVAKAHQSENYDALIELKWIRPSGNTQDEWCHKLVADAWQLESVPTELCNQYATRALLAVVLAITFAKKYWNIM